MASAPRLGAMTPDEEPPGILNLLKVLLDLVSGKTQVSWTPILAVGSLAIILILFGALACLCLSLVLILKRKT